MTQATAKLQAAQPIIEADGTMSQAFRTWALRVSNELLLVGTGSPEGSLEAPQYSLYLDEAVPAVPVQYRKMLAEIGSDKTKGWAAL